MHREVQRGPVGSGAAQRDRVQLQRRPRPVRHQLRRPHGLRCEGGDARGGWPEAVTRRAHL